MSTKIKFKSNKRKRLKKHGFLVRNRTKYGRNTIKRRRQKGRKRLSVSMRNK